MAAVIRASEHNALPYMNEILEALFKIIKTQSVEEQTIRGQALISCGVLASVAGTDKFPKEALQEFTQFALECLKQEDSKQQLRETAIEYFSDICKVVKSEMAPIFETVLDQALKSLTLNEVLSEE